MLIYYVRGCNRMKVEVHCPLAPSGNPKNTSDKRKLKIHVNSVLYFAIEIPPFVLSWLLGRPEGSVQRIFSPLTCQPHK